MTIRTHILRIFEQEDVNFFLTNRIFRRRMTAFVGWFSRIEQPLVRDVSIALWRFFSDLDLSEARTTRFSSLHDCFIRQLKDGARPFAQDPRVLASPCDAIVGSHGLIAGADLYQIKGQPYALPELLCDNDLVDAHRDGRYVTLRLKSSMYHRFHAPHDCRIDRVRYVPGDTWNVNPAALRRVERLYCKNERAILRTTLTRGGHTVTLVPVAAVLVASIRLHFLDIVLNIRHGAPNCFTCNADFTKGEEIGWFEHGSTIVVFAPDGFTFCGNVREGATIRAGEPLLLLP